MATDPKILSRYRVQHSDDPTTIPEDLAKQIEAYRRAVKVGNVAALIAALDLCADRRPQATGEALQSVPNWIVIETVQALWKALEDGSLGPRGNGPHRRYSAKWRDDVADLWRAHEVYKARSGERPIVRDGVVVGREPALTGEAVFEEASERLRGTFAFATPANLRRAFARFEERHAKDAERYFGTAIHLPEEL